MMGWREEEEDAERDELRAEAAFERKYRMEYARHPDCRDPDHPGCEDCQDTDDELED